MKDKTYKFKTTSPFELGDLISLDINMPTLVAEIHGVVKSCKFISHNPLTGLDYYEIVIDIVDEDMDILKQLRHIEKIKVAISSRGKR